MCVVFTTSISSLTLNQQSLIGPNKPYVVTCDGKLWKYNAGPKNLESSYTLETSCLVFGITIPTLTQEQQDRISIGCYVMTLDGCLHQYQGGPKTSPSSYDLCTINVNTLPTPTPTPTPSVTQTNTPTVTPTNTATKTVTPTPTPSVTQTNTPTVTPTNTITKTVTPTPTQTPTVTPTVTPTLTPTNTETPTLTPTNTKTPTVTPTNTKTPTVTPTITPSPSQLETLASCSNTFVPEISDQLIFNPLITLPVGECHEITYDNTTYDPFEWITNYMSITLNGINIAEVEYTPAREGTPFIYRIISGTSITNYPGVFTDFFTTFTEVELDPP